MRPSDVLAALEASAQRREFLAQTLRAAAESGQTQRLHVLADALARGVKSTDAEIADELAFVAALRQIHATHVSILVLFTRSENELGLDLAWDAWDRRVLPADRNASVRLLSRSLLEATAPVGGTETLDSVIAVLEGQGLIEARTVPQGYGGAAMPPHWRLTGFGEMFLRRIKAVADTFMRGPE
jgi:hypothetical protein